MILPDYVRAFLADALQPGVKEALLSTARKNSQNGRYCHVCPGAHGGATETGGPADWHRESINREKAGELLGQCRAIAEASGLEGLDFLRTPAPGLIRGPAGSIGGIPERRQIGWPFVGIRLVNRRRAGIDDVSATGTVDWRVCVRQRRRGMGN